MERAAENGARPSTEDGSALAVSELLAQAIRADFGHARQHRLLVDYDIDAEDEAGEDEDDHPPASILRKRKREGKGDGEDLLDEIVPDSEVRTLSTGARGAGGPCQGCGGEGRYRCPRCDVRSCGVACVRKHKEATGCTGVRDRTAFMPLRAMTDTHLHSGICLHTLSLPSSFLLHHHRRHDLLLVIVVLLCVNRQFFDRISHVTYFIYFYIYVYICM